jgi:predicted porin
MKTKSNLMLAGAMAMSIGALSNAQAQTNVTIYGVLDDAFVYSSNQNGLHNFYQRNGNLAGSKLGFKGTEDLGNGLQALFVLENGFAVDDGTMSSPGVLFNRQSFVGLGNQLGTVTAGRQYTPYYLFVGPVGPTSSLTGATGAHPGDIDGLDTTIRINNSVTYTSPVFAGGVQASAQYGMGEIAGASSSGATYSAALKYDMSPLRLALGYLYMKNGPTVGTTFDSRASGSFSASAINRGYLSAGAVQYLAAGARYKIGDVELGLNGSNVQYKPTSGSLFTSTATFNTLGVLATYQLTPSIFVSGGYSYTKEKAANGVTDPARYQQIALEQVYSFSPRTALYLLEAYQYAKGSTLGAGGIGNPVSAVAVVGDSQTGTPSSNSNQTVVMLGIRHSF